jgi:hypothetical protein
MKSFVYYGGERIDFDIPRGWNLLYGQEIHPEPGCLDPLGEVEKALDHPIDPPIEDLAAHCSHGDF